jgi:diguanylate cyclase (GGDEF)-like protein/PAS domain S-box-containing protein
VPPGDLPTALIDHLPDPVIIVDKSGVIHWVNDTAAEAFGRGLADWVGRSGLDLVHPGDVALVLSSLLTVATKTIGSPIEVRVRRNDRSFRLMEVVGRTIPRPPDPDSPESDSPEEGDWYLLLVLRDITERRRWEVAGDDLAAARTVVHHSPVVTLLTDRVGTVRSASGALVRTFGLCQEDAIGRNLCDLVPEGADRLLLAATLVEAAERGGTHVVELRFGAPVTARPAQVTLVGLGDDPVVDGLIVTVNDISELDAARRQLRHLAHHDALTGLPNARRLHDATAAALGTLPMPDVAVVYLDLDGFKAVNDRFGHDVGDALLVAVTRRLEGLRRPTDLIGRLGGDEFAFLVVGDGAKEVCGLLAGRIEAALAAPFSLGGRQVVVSGSVGTAGAEPGDDVASLIRRADLAMYERKHARGAALVVR